MLAWSVAPEILLEKSFSYERKTILTRWSPYGNLNPSCCAHHSHFLRSCWSIAKLTVGDVALMCITMHTPANGPQSVCIKNRDASRRCGDYTNGQQGLTLVALVPMALVIYSVRSHHDRPLVPNFFLLVKPRTPYLHGYIYKPQFSEKSSD